MRWECEIQRVEVTFSNNAEWGDTLHSVLVTGQPIDLHTNSQVRILYLACGRQLLSYHGAKRSKITTQSYLSTQSRLFCRKATGTSGSHWLFHLLRTFGKYFLLSKVCDKYLVTLWGFGVKILGNEWFIVLGLWWATWTSRVCSLNIG